MWTVGAAFLALLVVFYTHMIHRWRNPKCAGKLPPGNMGWPLVGETLHLLLPSYSMDVHPFLKKRMAKYGPIFQTSLVGKPVVVSADSELNSMLFQEDGKMVEMYYMDTFSKLFALEGENRVNLAGAVHRYVRTLPSVHFGPQKLKDGLLAEIESLVAGNLPSWSEKDSVEVKNASAVMLCEFMAKKVFGYDPTLHSSSKMTEKFIGMVDGLLCFPVNLPGSTYRRVLKDKDSVMKFLKDILEERLNSPNKSGSADFLDEAIAELNTQKFLTKDFLNQYIFGILFAGLESNSSTLTSALNYLHANPQVVQQLQVEHEGILKRRENPNSPLTWEEYKSMTFTHHVVSETLRLTNVSPGLLRKALRDIQYKGYTIPAGWTIMVATTALHMNSETYKDPLAFNPSRWQEVEPRLQSRILKPFGGGTRQCAGAEFSKAFLATFLHVLITKYKWTKIKGGNFVRNPLLGCDGLYINFKEKNN